MKNKFKINNSLLPNFPRENKVVMNQGNPIRMRKSQWHMEGSHREERLTGTAAGIGFEENLKLSASDTK